MLKAVKDGSQNIDEAVRALGAFDTEDLGFAQIDHHRSVRQGFPEVIYSENKTPDQVAQIAERIVANGSDLLCTRCPEIHAMAVLEAVPDAEYHPIARVVLRKMSQENSPDVGIVLVVAAGTSDLPVAEEAALTAHTMGNPVERLNDVGIAGIHRILKRHDILRDASVIVVVAGMEGALPSVVGGLVDVPVIAVPTSVGYGAAFGGIAALLGMLNSCASGVTVVNIDNGFGAGYAASLMNRLTVRA
ncbi:MAG: nickel pincer cofactor biosynthesis protein LarB [Candidatus Latescibacteria bacterium]|nr:nickel pincer cofactor biosynthesis protein LarB [Candidatus Latescibacterota bacterium]